MPALYLDTGVLGYLTHPHGDAQAVACARHLAQLEQNGWTLAVPEICDYELRRELVRLKSQRSLTMLDDLVAHAEYVPIATAIMHEASRLWALVRNLGKPTAAHTALDGDVILGASARLHSGLDRPHVATTNVGHLSLFADARVWADFP